MASVKQTSMQTHSYTGGGKENGEISSKFGTNFFCEKKMRKKINAIKLFVSLLAAKATPPRRRPRGKLFEVTQRDIFADQPAAVPTFLITVRGS